MCYCLLAATGRVVRTYDKTRFTDEILVEDGTLILSVNESPQKAAPVEDHPPVKKSVCAVDAETGKLLWKSERHIGVGKYSPNPF
ncbi:MAG: hypothetical protein V3R99_04035 [Thermoguttaceae bacterium]